MKITITIFLLIIGVININKLTAQGCSDAGFCTIGNLKQHYPDSLSTYKQKITLLLTNGIGDENVYVFTPGIQFDNKLNKSWAVQARLTVNYAHGNLGSATGLGDLFLSGSYTLSKKNNWETIVLLGTKIFLNNGDILSRDKPLPMQYQSSLGTVDLLTGISLSDNRWAFATAIQLPLTGTNRNTFLPAYYNLPKANKYSPSNDFKRKGDILLKAGYNLPAKDKLAVNIGLLGIYHLGRDTYIDGNISNKPIELKGSEGLTLNITAAVIYKVTCKFSIGLSGGVPFIVRDTRPDGLTRKFVVTPEFILNF